MPQPTPEEQIQFLTNLQRILSEGLFTATYKYALLLALADLAVEMGDDSGEPLQVPTWAIAEKFIEYYWRQATPYAASGTALVLKQNTDRQAKVIRLIAEVRHSADCTLAEIKRNRAAW